MITFVINADQRRNQLTSLGREIQRVGLEKRWEILRIMAFDAEQLSLTSLKAVTSPHGYLLDRASRARTMSYLKAWNTFVRDYQEHTACLILEDTCILDASFVSTVDEALQDAQEDDVDLLMLGHLGTHPERISWPLRAALRCTNRAMHAPRDVTNVLCEPFQVRSLTAHIVTRKGAMKLLELFSRDRIRAHLEESLTTYMRSKEINAYSVKHSVAFRKKEPTLTDNGFPQAISWLTRKLSSCTSDYLDEETDAYDVLYSYDMSSPVCEILGVPLNGYVLACILVAFLIGISGLPWVRFKRVCCTFFAIDLLRGERARTMITMSLMSFFWSLGATV